MSDAFDRIDIAEETGVDQQLQLEEPRQPQLVLNDAVLDARMRVRGVENLRVADMSAVPNINAGNTAAPAMMLGDRCADFILGLDLPGGKPSPTTQEGVHS